MKTHTEEATMSHVDKYETQDKAALKGALLALHICPQCRRDLQPVAFYSDVWGCVACHETWHLPR